MSEVLRRYPSDLTDAQWEKIRWLIPRSPPIGDDRRTSMREVVNAVFYISRGGCSWRMLPKDFSAVANGLRILCPLETG